MSSSSTQALSTKRKVVAFLALTIVGALSAATGVASAATEACEQRSHCISVLSSELGTHLQPNFVEAVLGGGAAQVGQPVGLKPADRTDPTEDIVPIGKSVSEFHAEGLASAEANRRYGNLFAVQQKYAPFGVETELCVGLERVADRRQGLTLQPCDSSTTVWIPHFGLASDAGYFPIINATTTDYRRPFAMHLPRDEVASGKPLQMDARRLQFRTGDKALPARQLWSVWDGALN